MSAALDALRELAAGRPCDEALLQNCRLEGFGIRVFGREAILELFRRSPIDLPATPDGAWSRRGLLALYEGGAIFADLHEERLVHLWVLGSALTGEAEPEVSVARDLDLTQAEGDVFFDPEDHPELAPHDAAALRETIKKSIKVGNADFQDLPSFSRRAFVVRAFSSGQRIAAMIVVAGAIDGFKRKPFSVNATLIMDAPKSADAKPNWVIDQAGLTRSREQHWTPRL